MGSPAFESLLAPCPPGPLVMPREPYFAPVINSTNIF